MNGTILELDGTTNTLSLAAIPEPSSALLAVGVAALVVIRRRRSA